MGIAQELKAELDKNQHSVYITDADDLLAAWRHRMEKSSGGRCFDHSKVAKEYRLSAPPNENAALMPCHVSVRRHRSHVTKTIKPAPGYSTISCHGHGRTARLSTQDLDALNTVSFTKRNMAPYISPILDLATLTLVCKDLGISGRAIPKVINGRQYIAFSGHPGLRTMLPGTIYRADNLKIINIAIGSLGIKNMVKKGGILTIAITVPLTVLELYLKDQLTLSAIAGSLTADIMIIGVSSLMGAAMGLAVGGVITVACAPIAVAIGASVLAGYILDGLDERLKLTEKLITALENMGDEMEKIAGQTKSALYRGTEGFFKSQGLRIPNY